MTIDERALQFINESDVPIPTDSHKYRALVLMLKEVARDQRHACAEAVARVDNNAWSKDAAHQAVMNANLE